MGISGGHFMYPIVGQVVLDGSMNILKSVVLKVTDLPFLCLTRKWD